MAKPQQIQEYSRHVSMSRDEGANTQPLLQTQWESTPLDVIAPQQPDLNDCTRLLLKMEQLWQPWAADHHPFPTSASWGALDAQRLVYQPSFLKRSHSHPKFIHSILTTSM